MRLPRRLRSRLVLSHLVVALAALGTVLVAVSLVGPGYFADAMGHGPNDPVGREMDAATLTAFQEAVRTALVAALGIALVAAVAVALALSSRIATPVSRLVDAARRIAAGHYAERVPTTGEGEVAELAETFNAMAGSLEATERRRLELVGDVAHELRTPLATIDGYVEGLQDGVVEPTGETWALLRRETGRLSRLVSDLSELWQAQARQLPLAFTSVDVSTVAGDVIDQFQPEAEPRGISLAVDIAEGTSARADPDRLAQILGNYLSNAIRYSPDGASVSLAAWRRDDEVIVSVRDTGPGLTVEQRTHVFDRFYRIDPSRSRALGGA
ncbi:MAG TPA: HAMP domain-containing protein, partial [Clostridia bacterium]|nr:HAMP domain-containing protein [Clostridia bacterium]